MFKRVFVDHPQSVGETYFQHMRVSASFGVAMLTGALGCFVHALVPSVCQKTGSGIVSKLHRRMVTHRTSTPEAAEEGANVHA